MTVCHAQSPDPQGQLLIFGRGKAGHAIITRARHRNDAALSAGAPAIITSTSATRPARAGKVRKKCGKNVFCITCRNDVCMREKCFLPHRTAPRRKPLRGPGAGHGLTAEGTPYRATSRPSGRPHGLRPDALPGERATPCGRIMHRNQDHGRAAGGLSGWQIMHRNQAAAGPCCWRARSCCPCRCPGSGLWPLAPAPAPALAPAWLSGSGSTGDRSRPGVPERQQALGAGADRKADMGRPYGLRPMG